MIRFLCLAFVFCLLSTSVQAAALPVIVSIAPQKYIVERLAGDAVSVTVLVTPGADPHVYEPTPSQMRAVQEARVWFSIGVPFEDIWLPRIQGATPSLQTVSMIKDISRLSFADGERARAAFLLKRGIDRSLERDQDGSPSAEEHPGHDHHSDDDPHVWLSPMLVRQMLPGLAKALGVLIPDKAALFRTNAAAFAAELEALDAELAEHFAAIPPERKVFLSFHPSWQYYAHSYQLTELSIEVDGKEPAPRAMQAIMDTAGALGIRTVFVEPQFPKGAAKAIAAHLGATVTEADPLGEDLMNTYRTMTRKLLASFGQ